MKTKQTFICMMLGLIAFLPLVQAADSGTDTGTFDQILAPVLKIYNFVKYAASVIAMLYLVFAGIVYMTSGADVAKREQAKNTAAYVVIGLILIWAAPHVVTLLTQ